MHLPFPDILHVYNQALNGFHRLYRRLGFFKVNEDCIGVNNQHIAKVWHSPNFASNHLERDNIILMSTVNPKNSKTGPFHSESRLAR